MTATSSMHVPPKAPTKVRDALRAVATVTGLPAAEIAGASRWRHLVLARWAVMRLARDGGRSLTQIGRGLGDRDHTTVLHGLVEPMRFGNRRPDDARWLAETIVRAQAVLGGAPVPPPVAPLPLSKAALRGDHLTNRVKRQARVARRAAAAGTQQGRTTA